MLLCRNLQWIIMDASKNILEMFENTSWVIWGEEMGRKIIFPTTHYPEIKLPQITLKTHIWKTWDACTIKKILVYTKQYKFVGRARPTVQWSKEPHPTWPTTVQILAPATWKTCWVCVSACSKPQQDEEIEDPGTFSPSESVSLSLQCTCSLAMEKNKTKQDSQGYKHFQTNCWVTLEKRGE